MAFGEDWLGWTIFGFIIVTIITIIIKVLILYPGLTELKSMMILKVEKESLGLTLVASGMSQDDEKEEKQKSVKG